MKTPLSKLVSKVGVQQQRQTENQPINNGKEELIKNNSQVKITAADITMQQEFWDKAVLS